MTRSTTRPGGSSPARSAPDPGDESRSRRHDCPTGRGPILVPRRTPGSPACNGKPEARGGEGRKSACPISAAERWRIWTSTTPAQTRANQPSRHLDFIARRENAVFLGQAGTGKATSRSQSGSAHFPPATGSLFAAAQQVGCRLAEIHKPDASSYVCSRQRTTSGAPLSAPTKDVAWVAQGPLTCNRLHATLHLRRPSVHKASASNGHHASFATFRRRCDNGLD